MKSDMKKNLSRLVALGLVLVLGACVKDDPTGPGGPFRESDVLVGVTFLTKKDPLPCWETGLWKGG